MKRWRAEVLYRAYNDLGKDLERIVLAKATERIDLVIQQTNDVRYIRDVRKMSAEYFQHKHGSLVLWDIYALKNEHNLPFMNALEVIAQSMRNNQLVRIELNETKEERFKTLFPGAAQDRGDGELGAEVYRLSLLFAIPLVNLDNTFGPWELLSQENKAERRKYMQAVYGLGLMVEQLIQSASQRYRPAFDFNTETRIIRTRNVYDRYFPADQLNGTPYMRKDISMIFQPKITSHMR